MTRIVYLSTGMRFQNISGWKLGKFQQYGHMLCTAWNSNVTEFPNCSPAENPYSETVSNSNMFLCWQQIYSAILADGCWIYTMFQEFEWKPVLLTVLINLSDSLQVFSSIQNKGTVGLTNKVLTLSLFYLFWNVKAGTSFREKNTQFTGNTF